MKEKCTCAFTLIEIMIVVPIIGLLAAGAIPGIQRSIETARQKTCMVNRKNIDGAKLQWAVENKQPLTATPEDAELFGPGLYLDHKPDCPAGGGYAINPVEQKCTCSVPKHVN